MKSISKPTFVAMIQARIKSSSSVQHWLLSFSLHIMLFSVLVFLTAHSKNQEIQTRIVETAFVVLTEQENQKKNPSTSSTQGRENREHYDKTKEIVSVKQPTVGDEALQVKSRKIEDSFSSSAQSQKFTIKASKEIKKLPAKEPNLLLPVPDSLSAVKKNVEPNAEPSAVNDVYTEFLTRIERRDAKFDPKPLVVKSGSIDVSRKWLQVNSKKNNSISNTKGPANSCSVRALERQAPLLGTISPGQYYEPGSNQVIRISDLVGHGRYSQPSMSVRVSDLLNVGSQLKQIMHPNVSVTVSDLLRHHGFGFQSFCQR